MGPAGAGPAAVPTAPIYEEAPTPRRGSRFPGVPRILLAAKPIWVALLAIAISALVVAAISFYAQGGRWFVVETPSMGIAAPVGTLVLTMPPQPSALRVGDVVTFHPPTSPGETYTHRISRILPNGALSTKGDVNGAVDPWQLGASDLVGSPIAVLPGLGWLIRGLPFLLGGALLLHFLSSRFTSGASRHLVRLLGFSIIVSSILAGFVVMATSSVAGGVRASIVSTGLLPIRLSAPGAAGIDLVDGQMGRIYAPTLGDNAGHYSVSSALNLPLWGWIIFGIVCALPLIWALLIGFPRNADTPETGAPTFRNL
jgi:signal peptidase I